MRMLVALALALPTIGCADILGLGEPTLAVDAGMTDAPNASCVEGPFASTRQFVINSFHAPTSAADAFATGFDLDGDTTSDNAMFTVIQSLGQLEPGFALQPTLDASLFNGVLLQLFQADLGAGCARTTLYQGEDFDVPVNPTDNFSGQETLRAVGTARGRMLGGLSGTSDVQAGAGGSAELRLPLFRDAAPIYLPLVVAQVRYAITSTGATSGVIGGAIRSDIIEGVVVPSFAESIQAIVARECVGGTPPDCCPSGSAGRSGIQLFDDDHDCVISAAEIAANPTIENLFSPDLDLYNDGVFQPDTDFINDSVSLGIAFTGVNASFITP